MKEMKEQESVQDAAWSRRDRIEQNQAAFYQDPRDPPSIKLETATEPGCVQS